MSAPRPRRHWRIGPGLFAARPKLVVAMAAGLAVALACALGTGLGPATCALSGWDTFCVLYLALALHTLADRGPADIRARAAKEDQGQLVVLALILTASGASLLGAGLELSLAQATHGVERALRIIAAFGTLTASWFLMQVVFALHYAHEYYAAHPKTGKDIGGLAFPGGEAPDYWDFLHFTIVIGVAAQTADVAFTDRRLRRLGTLHSLIAFTFNTLILALTINLVAGLF